MLNITEAPTAPTAPTVAPIDDENLIVDKETGVVRPKEKKPAPRPTGVVPKAPSRNSMASIILDPKNWFLTQSSALGTIPLNKDGSIPPELIAYINKNFNVYPTDLVPFMEKSFPNSLIFKNHRPTQAYGFTILATPRAVQVGNHTLQYMEILSAINRNIDKQFAKDIEDRKIKFMSFAHSSGTMRCAVCNNTTVSCSHIQEMLFRTTPQPALKDGKPYGLIHGLNEDFHVYETSYLTEVPAYDGAVSHNINSFDKPLHIEIDKEVMLEKARLSAEHEDYPKRPDQILHDLFNELGIL